MAGTVNRWGPWVATCLLLGCGTPLSQSAGPATATTPSASQAAQVLRVHVASDVAIVAEGDTQAGLAEKLRTAVEAELGRRGLRVAAAGDKTADATVRIESRVKGAVYFLRGHVGLTAERGGIALATAATDDEIHRGTEFPTKMAEKAVDALLRSPALNDFAAKRVARREPPRQAPRPPPVAPVAARAAAPEVEARSHYNRGTGYFNLGRYREALAEYEAAYLSVQDPPFLFNIAQCQRKMGRDQEALAAYRSYLRVAPNAPNRAEVQKRIADLERQQPAALARPPAR